MGTMSSKITSTMVS